MAYKEFNILIPGPVVQVDISPYDVVGFVISQHDNFFRRPIEDGPGRSDELSAEGKTMVDFHAMSSLLQDGLRFGQKFFGFNKDRGEFRLNIYPDPIPESKSFTSIDFKLKDSVFTVMYLDEPEVAQEEFIEVGEPPTSAYSIPSPVSGRSSRFNC